MSVIVFLSIYTMFGEAPATAHSLTHWYPHVSFKEWVMNKTQGVNSEDGVKPRSEQRSGTLLTTTESIPRQNPCLLRGHPTLPVHPCRSLSCLLLNPPHTK